MFAIRALLADASKALGYHEFVGDDGSHRHTIPKRAASFASPSLNELAVPDFAADEMRQVHFPLDTEAGKRTTLSSGVALGSRVADAGARIIVMPSAAEQTKVVDGVVGFFKHSVRFDLIEAADFASVPDGGEVDDSALPLFSAPVDLGEAANLGFRVALSRAEQKAYAEGVLADSALASIILGLARAADRTLLDAIVATTPSAFSLGAAAAQGFKFGELSAFVGTNGTGAAVGPDGILRAVGIPAELTPATAQTIVGAFNRAGVGIANNITLTAERTNARGDLILTCWANMVPLLPMPGAFWMAEAA